MTNRVSPANQNAKNILVSGGAGYIGSHAVLALKDKGYQPIILDDLSNGSKFLAESLGVPFIKASTDDSAAVKQVCEQYSPVAAMHFAAFAYVGESVTDPAKYYNNNFSSALSFVTTLKDCGVKRFIFSSTCATYGIPNEVPIRETTHQSPVNPYGRSKLMVEQMLKDFDVAYGVKSMIFRYFNASGADSDLRSGELHNPETHLIPLVIKAALTGTTVKIFGTDYPTMDGTCIRDYIHVSDIANAHLLGLERLLHSDESDIFNIGNGNGYSNLEIIKTVEACSGREVRWEPAARREGDPPVLVADASKLHKSLGWNPAYPEIAEIIKSALRWHERHPVS